MKLIHGDGIAEVGSSETLEHGSGFLMVADQKTSYGSKAVCLDEIINRVGSCRIQEESHTMHDLGIILGNLKLESTDDGEIHQPHPIVEQLPENQQQQDHEVSKDMVDKLIEEDTVGDDLVKLRAPSCDDYEEEDNNEVPDEDGVACLLERGPMYGIPSKCPTAAFQHAIPMSPGRPPDIPIHKRGMDDAGQKPSKYFRLQDAGQRSLGGMSGHDVLYEESSASDSCVKMVSQTSTSVKQMSGGTLYTSEIIKSCPGQIIRDVCDNPEFSVTNCHLDVFSPEHSIITGHNLNIFLPQPGSPVGHDSKKQVNEYQHESLGLQQRYQPSVGNFNKSLDSHHSKVCQQTTPQVPFVEWGSGGHGGGGFNASSTFGCCLYQHPAVKRSDTTVYGSLTECNGCSTVLHESPTALHGSPTALHGSSTALHGSPTALHGSPTALHGSPRTLHESPTAVHGSPTALHGSPTALHGSHTALLGSPTALHGSPRTLYGSSTALHGSPTTLHGYPTAVHGSLTALHGSPTALHGSPTALHESPTALHGSPTTLHGSPTTLYGSPTAVHGSYTALYGSHPVLHGSCTAFCGSSSALHRSLTSLLEPSTAVHRSPTRLCGPHTALCGPFAALHGSSSGRCVAPAALLEPPATLCGSLSGQFGPPAALLGTPATLCGSPSGQCRSPATLGGSAASLYNTPSASCGFPTRSLLSSPASTIRPARSFDSGVCSPLSENSIGHPQLIKTVVSCDQDSNSASVDSCIDENTTSSELNLILEFINQEMEEQKQQSQISPARGSSLLPESVTSHSLDGLCCSSMPTGSENMARQNFPHPRTGIDCSRTQCASDNKPWPATYSRICLLDGVPKSSFQGAPESMTAVSSTSLPVASGQGHTTVASSQGGALMVPLKLVVITQQALPSKTSPSHYRPICPKIERAGDPPGQAVSSGFQVGSSNADHTDTTATVLPAREEQKQHKYSDVQKLTKARRSVADASLDDLRSVDDDGDNCVHVAVCQTDDLMVQAILERLVRDNIADMINAQNLQGQTPLYLATSTNNTKTVAVLVEYGADANLLAESMTSCGTCQKLGAIHCASTKGENYLDTLKALLAAPGIKLNLVNSEGHTALNCAVLSHGKMGMDNKPINSVSIIQALICAGANPNIQVRQNGKTALMFALESRDLDLIEKMFQLVEPSQLYSFLRTQASDGSSCIKIAKSLKKYLDPAGQRRLSNCLKLTARRVSL